MACGTRGSLSLLTDRIRRHALVVGDDDSTVMFPVEEITIGSAVIVRHAKSYHSTASC